MPSETEQICQKFEQAWEQGKPQAIETVLRAGDQASNSHLLEKLLRIEIQQRLQRGEQPTSAEYVERFPQCGSLVQAILSPTLFPDDTLDLKTNQPADTTDFSYNLMSQPTAGDPPPGSGSATGLPSNPRQSIGRYTVIGLLGRGGQADVFRAVHPTLPMEVAIKLTHATLPERARDALLAEAHILCDLDHPHIARVRDFDFDDGRPYLVLDYIRGRSLSQVAATERFSSVAAAMVVAKVARAIGFAHAAGVIHRDLKPENVVIDASGEPKIIDFGVSRMRSGMVSEMAERNEISGTLAYMPPEQAAGLSESIDHRVDVFALGAILYRLLVGQAPYASQPLPAMLATVRQGDWDVQRLETCPIPEELKAICQRAMSYAPDQRFQNAESLAAALDHFVAAATGAASVGAVGDATTKPADRGSWIAPAAILGAVISTLAIVFYLADPFALQNFGTNIEPTAATTNQDSNALIQNFEVVHIGNSTDRAPQENDDIQIQADFSEPVYCFLVAFNPDGVKQLCFPRDSSVAQSEPIQALRYPADADSAFGLTDGVGQQAFVLYASRTPLPSFETWQTELITASWPSPEITGNWWYQAGQLQVMVDPLSTSPLTRGVERRTKTPTSFKAWCDALRQAEKSDVRGVTFSVQPKP